MCKPRRFRKDNNTETLSIINVCIIQSLMFSGLIAVLHLEFCNFGLKDMIKFILAFTVFVLARGCHYAGVIYPRSTLVKIYSMIGYGLLVVNALAELVCYAYDIYAGDNHLDSGLLNSLCIELENFERELDAAECHGSVVIIEEWCLDTTNQHIGGYYDSESCVLK